ncbi:Gfo/Idh/MocA family protein [Pedococcus sp. NPDC057267]|uniref:Gfo/Idh/MocA family protein n=1 Tax=Pedococcus sp. NPDC057267 TaxID=3346077 RepID=UPI003633B89C
MRVGVVGAGAIAVPHVRAWQELGADVLVHSRRPPTEFAERHGTAVAADLDALLATSDLVDVCSPTDTHEEVVLAAVAARLPVICEKPLARTAHGAQALVDAARQAGVPLLPAHVVRWFPAYEALWARVSTGVLGIVEHARFTRQVQAPPDDTWFHDGARSGGVVLDLMLHDLDQALWLFGPVRAVTAQALDPRQRSVRAVLAHESGVTTTVEATWGPLGTPFATAYAVTGSRGSTAHDTSADGASSDEPVEGEDPYLRQARELRDAALTGAAARVTADDGVAAVALAERVLERLPS